MADAIQADWQTGLTLYALVRNAAGLVWNGTAFVTYATGSLASYAIAMTEEGSASGYYFVAFPSAIVAGQYSVVVKQQLGGSPAETDITAATGSIDWTGSQFGFLDWLLLQLSGSTIEFISPVDPITGNVRIVGGDYYTSANGRILFWNVTPAVVDLTGSTLQALWYFSNLSQAPVNAGSPTFTNPGASNQQIQLSLTGSDSASVIGCTLLTIVATSVTLGRVTPVRVKSQVVDPSLFGQLGM